MVIILMGVAGSGKTAVGKALAAKTGIPFLEGDSLHPSSNRKKMARGIALNDSDRMPWLMAIKKKIATTLKKKESLLLSCSALKESYRKSLSLSKEVLFVYLKGEEKKLQERLEKRTGHFFPKELLSSQFAILEEPKEALSLDAFMPIPTLVEKICHAFSLNTTTL